MKRLQEKLGDRIQRKLGRKVCLVLHDNRAVMLSFRRGPVGRVVLRLHHLFLAAGPPEIAAIADFLRSKDAAARRVVENFIARYGHLIGVKLPESIRPARGRVYDLQRIFDALNRRYFRNRVRAEIVWGRRVKRERKHSIRLGYYCEAERKIVINPALDRGSVPKYFLEWIVFHEMLHQVVGFTTIRGMSVAHTPEFRRREHAFPRYARASEWESRNLSRLLRA